MKRLLWSSLSLLLVVAAIMSACAAPTPEVITVVETVEKIIEKEGETKTIIEEKEVVVTATPEPLTVCTTSRYSSGGKIKAQSS